jgi:hypothetical protein
MRLTNERIDGMESVAESKGGIQDGTSCVDGCVLCDLYPEYIDPLALISDLREARKVIEKIKDSSRQACSRIDCRADDIQEIIEEYEDENNE